MTVTKLGKPLIWQGCPGEMEKPDLAVQAMLADVVVTDTEVSICFYDSPQAEHPFGSLYVTNCGGGARVQVFRGHYDERAEVILSPRKGEEE